MSFKKLDDLPKGKPHTYDDVMKAMTELHRLVLKQSEAYGGKNSKLIRAQVTEGSLLKSLENLEEDCDESARLMGLAHERAEELADHLKNSDDNKGMNLLGQVLKYIGLAIKESSNTK